MGRETLWRQNVKWSFLKLEKENKMGKRWGEGTVDTGYGNMETWETWGTIGSGSNRKSKQ